MNALNRIGGALLVAGLAVAVIIGFQTPTGRRFWDGIWQAGATVVSFAGDQFNRIPALDLSGQSAILIGLAVFGGLIAIATIFAGKTVNPRGLLLIAVASTAVAVVLYSNAS